MQSVITTSIWFYEGSVHFSWLVCHTKHNRVQPDASCITRQKNLWLWKCGGKCKKLIDYRLDGDNRWEFEIAERHPKCQVVAQPILDPYPQQIMTRRFQHVLLTGHWTKRMPEKITTTFCQMIIIISCTMQKKLVKQRKKRNCSFQRKKRADIT